MVNLTSMGCTSTTPSVFWGNINASYVYLVIKIISSTHMPHVPNVSSFIMPSISKHIPTLRFPSIGIPSTSNFMPSSSFSFGVCNNLLIPQQLPKLCDVGPHLKFWAKGHWSKCCYSLMMSIQLQFGWSPYKVCFIIPCLIFLLYRFFYYHAIHLDIVNPPCPYCLFFLYKQFILEKFDKIWVRKLSLIP